MLAPEEVHVIADNLPPVPISNPDPSSAILSGEAFGSEAGLGTGTTGAEAAGLVGTPSGACDQQRYRFVSSPPLSSEVFGWIALPTDPFSSRKLASVRRGAAFFAGGFFGLTTSGLEAEAALAIAPELTAPPDGGSCENFASNLGCGGRGGCIA